MPPTSLLYQRAPSTNICTTPTCIAARDLILSYVNLDVDPCSDFFQYTCSSWLKSPPLQEKKEEGKKFDTFEQLNDVNIDKLESILNGTYDDIKKNYKTSDVGFHTQDEESIDRSNFEFLKNFYNTCKDLDEMVSLGPTPLFADIAQIENVLYPVNGTNINLATTLAQLTLIDVEPLFSIDYNTNPNDHSMYLAYVGKPTPTIDINVKVQKIGEMIKRYLGASSTKDDTYKFIQEQSTASNFTLWSDAKIMAAAESYLRLSNELRLIGKDIEDENESDYNSITIQELQTILPYIDWQTYFTKLTGTEYVAPEFSVEASVKYFQRLHDLLKNTHTIELQEYLIISFLNHQSEYLLLEAPDKLETPISEVCAAVVGRRFKDLVGRYFVLETFGDINDEKSFLEMVLMLKESWLNHIPGISWLDKETKSQAVNKINLLKEKIIYNHNSPNWADPSSLQEYYKGAMVNSSSYYDAISRSVAWENAIKWVKFTQKVPEIEWSPDGYVQQVNAFYQPSTNQIEIPIGIIQSPFYNAEFPQYVNFGGIGAVLGHELVHSLDSTGRHYNGSGYMVDWWSSSSDAEFEKRAECIIGDYSLSYTIDENGKKDYVNGTLGSGEEIADAGGLTIAYFAYQQYVLNQLAGVPEPALPGLEHLTSEQMFFISHGISFCELLPPSQVHSYDNEEHPPNQFRINIPLQNSVEFAKAFNCPVGKSKMNPKQDKDKCVVW